MKPKPDLNTPEINAALARRFNEIGLPSHIVDAAMWDATLNYAIRRFFDGRAVMIWDSMRGELRFK